MIPCLVDFARQVEPLEPGTDLSKAMHAFRTAGMTALPVVENGRVIGHLTEHDAALALGPDPAQPESDPSQLDSPPLAEERRRPAGPTGEHEGNRDRDVGDRPGARESVTKWQPAGRRRSAAVVSAMRSQPDLRAAPSESIATAWEKVRAEDLPFLAVTDPLGVLLGVATRAELLAGLQGDLRPATLGGLATPLGVYLTTLHHRAGAGDLGLFLAGALLMSLDLLAIHGTYWLSWYVPALGSGNAAAAGLSDLGLVVALLAFFALLRLSPLTGTHAAEHQVVHAIEKGDPLVVQAVTAQPKEHPRCGTNLAAAALAAQVALPRVAESPALAATAVVALFFLWRNLGWVLQRLFTTRKARPRQLEGAIAAGRELLASYSRRPVYRAPRWRRVWNTGAVQILLGAAMVLLASEWLS